MHRSPIQLAAALTLAVTCTACREQPAPPPHSPSAAAPTPAPTIPASDPSLTSTTVPHDTNETYRYTLRGTFIRRPQTKSFESWNAACESIHLLELDAHHTVELPLQRTIQLRPSTHISCDDLDTFADAIVEIECAYTQGQISRPPQVSDSEHIAQRPIGPDVNATEQPQSRYSGFIVTKIRRLDTAAPATASPSP